MTVLSGTERIGTMAPPMQKALLPSLAATLSGQEAPGGLPPGASCPVDKTKTRLFYSPRRIVMARLIRARSP